MAKKESLSAIAKRFGITAREVRDIATALGTSAKASTIKAGPRMAGDIRANLKQQVKEAGVAAVTGKKGTTSSKFVTKGGKTTYKSRKVR